MAKHVHRIGILCSVTGPYATPCRSMSDGIRVAVDQVNADPHLDIELDALFADPCGDNRRYRDLGKAFLADGIRQIVGCYTSSSRKELIPLVEGGAGLLWFPMHYEGFETASNVVYTGASPNHNIVPLLDYVLRNTGTKAFCIGSDYIWAWENHRVLRETVLMRGGNVAGECLLPVGEVGASIDAAITAILQAEPDFVSNALIGDSSYAFIRRFRETCEQVGIDQPTRFPMISCTLNEAELSLIGADACDGHITSSVYFSSLSSKINDMFVADFDAHGIARTQITADAETSFVAIKLLAASLHDAGSDHPRDVIKALSRQRLSAPQGDVWVDPENLHAFLTPRIGLSRKDFTFEVLAQADAPQAPDPYLIRTTPRVEVLESPVLRLVA